MNFKKTAMALLAVLLVASAPVTAQAGTGLNTEADSYPETKIVEDRLTVQAHDRASMDWLNYEGDNGKIRKIDATVNGTESGAEVAYRADRIDAEAFGMFPRVGGEENNSITWLDTSNWSSTAGVSVTDTDGSTGSGVDSITVATNGSLGSADSVSSSYSEASITSDAEKRYLQFVTNVNSLEAGTEVSVQVRDGNGDYVEATANSSASTTSASVFANSSADGIVFQQQLGQLNVQGSGDGSLDAVEEVRVVVEGGDADLTITGLNVEKKSRWDFGDERVLDTSTDDSDDYTGEAVYNHAGGEINASGLTGMGETFDEATIHELAYLNVEYRMSDSPDEVSASFEKAENYPNYDDKLTLTANFTVPTAYDLTHSDMRLVTEQSFLQDRYLTIRYAEGVGDKSAEEIGSSEWIDLSGALGEQGQQIEADSTVQPDTTYKVQIDALVLDDQKKALQQTGGGGGFWGSDDSGGPLSSVYNWFVGGVVGLLSTVGLKMRMG